MSTEMRSSTHSSCSSSVCQPGTLVSRGLDAIYQQNLSKYTRGSSRILHWKRRWAPIIRDTSNTTPIPEHFRVKLVQAIKEVHSELLEPPQNVKNNPNWVKGWIPTVKRDIDWEGVLKAGRSKLGSTVGGSAVPQVRPTRCAPAPLFRPHPFRSCRLWSRHRPCV